MTVLGVEEFCALEANLTVFEVQRIIIRWDIAIVKHPL